MSAFIVLPIREANLLRSRFRALVNLRHEFLHSPGNETIHDFRVVSRRVREALDYLQPVLPEKWYGRLESLTRRITKSLGNLRETEVNLSMLRKWQEEQKIDSVAAELLIHSQQQQFEQYSAKARKRIGSREFRDYNKFLTRLKGSRTLIPTDSTVLDRRNQEFLSFSWEGTMDDERLHDLRIRTKTFRYAMEIFDRLHTRNQGRFTRRIRDLQETLGRIHDLYIVAEIARTEAVKWEGSGMEIIPAALKQAYEVILAEKARFYPLVFPRYSRILENSPLLTVGPPLVAAS